MTSHVVVHVGDKTYPWGRDYVSFSEAEAVERKAGMSWDAFCEALDSGSTTAQRVLAWSVLRRDNKDLRIEDVDMPIGQVRTERLCDDCGKPMVALQWKAHKLEDGTERPAGSGTFHADTALEECGEPEPEPEPAEGPTGPAGENAPEPQAVPSPNSDETTGSTPPESSASD